MDVADAKTCVRTMAEKKYKQVTFNELTLQPLCVDETDIYKRVLLYARTLKEAQNSLGAKMVRYDDDLAGIKLSEDITLRDFCAKHKCEAGVLAILSSATMPQVNPDDEKESKVYEKTIASVEVEGKQEVSSGLTSAYVYDVPSIGFASSYFWTNVMHDVHVMSDGENMDVKWPCLTAPKHIEEEAFKNWIVEHSEIELVKSALSYNDKIKGLEDNLRDDHGKEVLREHAKRLCHSEYVEGILCSRPFQPKCGTYIYSFTKDGLVDVVLFWDDRGLSMRVKTTGRNVQETAAIAAMLQEEYSR